MPHKSADERAEYNREWKRRNPEKTAWYRKIGDARRHANQRAEKYGAPGYLTTEEVADILRTAECNWCADPTGRIGIDHVVPLWAGGANRPENIVASCHGCNAQRWRSIRPPAELPWARQHTECVVCGTTERRHSSRGRCMKCDSTYRTRRRREISRAT